MAHQTELPPSDLVKAKSPQEQTLLQILKGSNRTAEKGGGKEMMHHKNQTEVQALAPCLERGGRSHPKVGQAVPGTESGKKLTLGTKSTVITLRDAGEMMIPQWISQHSRGIPFSHCMT